MCSEQEKKLINIKIVKIFTENKKGVIINRNKYFFEKV